MENSRKEGRGGREGGRMCGTTLHTNPTPPQLVLEKKIETEESQKKDRVRHAPKEGRRRGSQRQKTKNMRCDINESQ